MLVIAVSMVDGQRHTLVLESLVNEPQVGYAGVGGGGEEGSSS